MTFEESRQVFVLNLQVQHESTYAYTITPTDTRQLPLLLIQSQHVLTRTPNMTSPTLRALSSLSLYRRSMRSVPVVSFASS